MGLGLLRGELAAADELGDERVVVGELLERPVANQVRPRVADVADRDAVVLDEREPSCVVPMPVGASSSGARS